MKLKGIYQKYNIPIRIISIILLVVMFVVIAMLDYKNIFGPEIVRVPKDVGSTYFEVMKILERSYSNNNNKIRPKIDTISSEGSINTYELLMKGDINLGIVQGDIDCSNINIDKCPIRSIAQLYPEVFLFFTNHDNIQSVGQLCEKFITGDTLIRVASLGMGSQTYKDMYKILGFYGIPKRRILHMTATNQDHNDNSEETSYEKIKNALVNKHVDLGFFISGIPHPTIKELAIDTNNITLLEINNREEVSRWLGNVSNYNLPLSRVGCSSSEKVIKTIQTSAILVVNEEISKYLIYKFADHIKKYSGQISKRIMHITGDFYKGDSLKISTKSTFKMHDGAMRAFNNKKYTFIAKEKDLLKLIFTMIGVLVGTASLSFQVWINTKRK